jgi:hypothetical protein
MALRLLPPAIFPSPALVCPSPPTIKGQGVAPGHRHTDLTLNRLLPSPQRPLHRAPPPRIIPQHRSVVSNPPPPNMQLVRLTSSPLHFSSTAVRFHARGRRSGRSPVSLPRDGDRGPPWTGTARGPRARGLGPWVSLRKIIPGNPNFRHFAFRPLSFSKVNPQSRINS